MTKQRDNSPSADHNNAADGLRLASLIAHQLQSPLNAISMALQSVLAEYTGPLLPSQRAPLERASARCDQAVTTVRRMLAIVKAQDSAGTASTASSRLDQTIQSVHSEYSSEAARRHIQIHLSLHSNEITVRLGESAMSEILGVILNNAMKYTPDHGRINISTQEEKDRGVVILSVEDSGIGVPEDERERVFTPFHRSSSAKTLSQAGIGLGLAFVKSMVTSAGGSASIAKSPLGGADIRLVLPVGKTLPSTETTPAAMRVVIIGGVTAGPKAAARINRLMPNVDITVIERDNILSYAGCGLPYYVSGVVRDPKNLLSSPVGVVRDPVFFRNVMNVHVLNQAHAQEIDRAGKRVRVHDTVSGRERWLPYDKLLLATGASAVIPEGFSTSLGGVFTLHGMRDAEGIRSALADARARDVIVLGGGLIGIEMTEALVRKGARVTVIEMRSHILPMLDADLAILVERRLEANGVRIITGTKALSLSGQAQVSGVVTDKGTYPADLVIMAMGIRPNVELAVKAGLRIGDTGAVWVDELMRTTDPNIFAAGDCVENRHLMTGRPAYVPLGTTATKQGRVAAANICGTKDKFPGILGTCICRVFDYAIGVTGLGEREAQVVGFDVLTVLTAGLDREHFMPNASLLMMKMIVDRKTRRVLGVQVAGEGGGDKRIDVAAMAIAGKMTVDELSSADLGYAPPFSTAIDNLITAANIARNKLDGIFDGITPDSLRESIEKREDILLLDVRTPAEHDHKRLPNSVLIPLATLRARVHELPKDRRIVVYCDIGLRSYEAALVLKQAGFKSVGSLEGGLAMWPHETLS